MTDTPMTREQSIERAAAILRREAARTGKLLSDRLAVGMLGHDEARDAKKEAAEMRAVANALLQKK